MVKSRNKKWSHFTTDFTVIRVKTGAYKKCMCYPGFHVTGYVKSRVNTGNIPFLYKLPVVHLTHCKTSKNCNCEWYCFELCLQWYCFELCLQHKDLLKVLDLKSMLELFKFIPDTTQYQLCGILAKCEGNPNGHVEWNLSPDLHTTQSTIHPSDASQCFYYHSSNTWCEIMITKYWDKPQSSCSYYYWDQSWVRWTTGMWNIHVMYSQVVHATQHKTNCTQKLPTLTYHIGEHTVANLKTLTGMPCWSQIPHCWCNVMRNLEFIQNTAIPMWRMLSSFLEWRVVPLSVSDEAIIPNFGPVFLTRGNRHEKN